MGNKSRYDRGISSIIATLLLIVLTIVLIAIVWGVINGLVNQKINTSSACFGNYNSVSINARYTCYNNTDPNNNFVQFSLNIGYVDVEGILVSISSSGQSESFTITNSPQTIANLVYYNGTSPVALPGKNSGMTYDYNGSIIQPNSIQIAPIIKGQQCPTSDSLTTIDNCQLIT